tara:strand:+ start:1916 stop:2185 length:270 start_codon:yes stop_codon:yes gene_type:complete
MDIIEQLVIEVFENRQDYSDLDYLTIMNILKETYMRFNGDIPTASKDLEQEEEFDDDFDEEDLYNYNLSYSNYYADEEEGYLSDYVNPY